MVAGPDQIPTDLTLEIGADLSPDRFIALARAFFGYVQEISESFAPEGNVPQWIVRVREGSMLLAVDPGVGLPPESADIVYARAERGIERLTAGDLEDSGLPEPAIRYLRTLAEAAEGTPGKTHPVPMRLWVKRKPIPVEPGIASVIREDWRANYSDYGTIEGRLETIQEVHGGLQFQIRDAMLRQKVRCYFPEELLPEVFEKFRKRVEVSGLIHYRKNGTPIGIEAERIQTLPDDSELPTAEDVRGILRN
jgi:hypothetical protein